jgi:HEAT repeat protein
LMAELEGDPEYQARVAAKEQERLARVAKNREDAAPIVAELVKAGFAVESIRELLTKKLDFRAAIPLLLAWLPKVTNLDVKESIVRTISVPFAKPLAARPLVKELLDTDDSAVGLRWAIGNALEIVADDDVVDELIYLARERRFGKAREMVVVGLGNMTDSRVIPVLLDLLKDDEVSGHAIMALGKLKVRAARAHVEPFLKHPKAWVRREAEKTIAKIDEAAGRLH